MDEIARFIDDFVGQIRDDSAAIFAGAGLSIPAGMVDWRGLMREIAADVNLDIDKESDLVSVAQYHVNERRGRHRINEALVTEFAERAELTRNHQLLAALPIRTYWTTNYDTLIEQALRESRKRVDVKHADENLSYTLRQRDVVVYKLHGDVSQPDSAVVTRDDYEIFATKRPLLVSALQGDLVSKTFLFLGFSFSDPNLAYILSRIRVLLGENRRDHYALMRKVHRSDFQTDPEYNYAQVRQDLQINDLRRYGIHGLLVDSYDDYTAVLTALTDRFKRRRVFVAGSASTFAPLSTAEGQELLRLIGRAIIEAGFDLINGFGLGVGPYLLNGALEGLGDTGTNAINDRLVLRPFPQGIADPEERKSRWRSYREGMIAEAGIAVFLFGNKIGPDSQVVAADGMNEEFELAGDSGLVIVPVGATGYISKDIYTHVLDNFSKYYGDHDAWRAKLEELGSFNDPLTLVAQLIEMLNTIRES